MVSQGFILGTIALTYTWGYEDVQTGAGCDSDQYYYPKNPVVTIKVNGEDLEDYKLQLAYSSHGSDCFEETEGIYTLTSSVTSGTTYSTTILGTKSWSNGDSADNYAYANVSLQARLEDTKTGRAFTALWGSSFIPLTFRCNTKSKTWNFTGDATL